ncbi:uncharacterized protein LOC134737651 [Pongo pygmaeus]|uniref:uncharacterized protein LOC134737651 n=1 Tax=Pongo pygmaeus TaxID=9600 RepID=UPI00300CA89D
MVTPLWREQALCRPCSSIQALALLAPGFLSSIQEEESGHTNTLKGSVCGGFYWAMDVVLIGMGSWKGDGAGKRCSFPEATLSEVSSVYPQSPVLSRLRYTGYDFAVVTERPAHRAPRPPRSPTRCRQGARGLRQASFGSVSSHRALCGMGCAEGKAVAVAAPTELQTKGKNGDGRRRSGSSDSHASASQVTGITVLLAKDHHPGKTLPENPAGFTSTATADPRALLQAYIDGHSVVIFSRSTCTRCTEVKKLFKSLCVPYFVLELDQIANSSYFPLELRACVLPNCIGNGVSAP